MSQKKVKKRIYDSLPSLDHFDVTNKDISNNNTKVPLLEKSYMNWNTSPLDGDYYKKYKVTSIQQLLKPQPEEEDGPVWLKEEEDDEDEKQQQPELTEIQQEHERQINIIPILYDEYLNLLNHYSLQFHCFDFTSKTVNFTNSKQLSLTGNIQQELQDNRRCNPQLRTAEFENELLSGSSGIWYIAKYNKFIHFPPCRAYDKCVGYTHNLFNDSNIKLILRSGMNEETYSKLIINGTLDKPYNPYNPELCVLCHRYTACRLDLNNSLCKMQGNDDFLLFKPSIYGSSYDQIQQFQIQTYYNKRDEKDGYFSQYMLCKNDKDIFVQPIVLFQPSKLRPFLNETDYRLNANKEKIYDSWGIDQRLLIYQENNKSKPLIGEKVKDYLVS